MSFLEKFGDMEGVGIGFEVFLKKVKLLANHRDFIFLEV